MNSRTAREAIGQVFRESGKSTNIVWVAGVSVCYKAGEKLELSKRDSYPSDELIETVCSVAREYGVMVNAGDIMRFTSDEHDVVWTRCVWMLHTVKLDDLVNGGVTDGSSSAANAVTQTTWDTARSMKATLDAARKGTGKSGAAQAPLL